MPSRNGIRAQIPALYQRSALNLSLYAFVRGVRAALPTVSVKDAVFLFMEEYGLTEELFNSDSAIVAFHEMNREIKGHIKNIKNER